MPTTEQHQVTFLCLDTVIALHFLFLFLDTQKFPKHFLLKIQAIFQLVVLDLQIPVSGLLTHRLEHKIVAFYNPFEIPTHVILMRVVLPMPGPLKINIVCIPTAINFHNLKVLDKVLKFRFPETPNSVRHLHSTSTAVSYHNN